MTMIALGGSIGTGLFLASGKAIAEAGPGGALVAYITVGVMVYFLMMSLGELATFMPDSGSFNTYATRFVDPALGFALGWNFWYNWAVTIAAEIAASTLLVKYWFPNSSSFLWNAIFLIIIIGLNVVSVQVYGEAEYWFAVIKVATIILFLSIGILTILGIFGQPPIGLDNFTIGDGPFHCGFFGIFGVFIAAGFSFQGTEMVGVAAGESENPSKTVPLAIRRVFWRILIFYILAIAIISFIIPYTDVNLLKEGVEHIAISPFTLVFKKAGLALSASVMNAVILTAVLSAGNSGLYAASRVLYALALDGKAPRFLSKLNKNGIPMNALLVTASVGGLAFLSCIFGDKPVYGWLLNASGLCGFITWLGIAISHYRFRKAYIAQGKRIKDLPFRARLFPLGPIVSFTLCIVIIIGQNYKAFSSKPIDWCGIAVSYWSVPLFFILWLAYKWKFHTRVIPLKQCDFHIDTTCK